MKKEENNGLIFLIGIVSWIVTQCVEINSIPYLIFTALWIICVVCLVINMIREGIAIHKKLKLLEELQEKQVDMNFIKNAMELKDEEKENNKKDRN